MPVSASSSTAATDAHDPVPLPGLGALPLLLAAAWWNEMLRIWCGTCVLRPREHVGHQFIVPDCLEEVGEHALFA